MAPERSPNPVLSHAHREAIFIASMWLLATTYCCGSYYFLGLSRPDRPLGLDDLHFVWGMPGWVFWGIVVPWGFFFVITVVFAGFLMTDDDLGQDEAEALDEQIRGGGETHE